MGEASNECSPRMQVNHIHRRSNHLMPVAGDVHKRNRIGDHLKDVMECQAKMAQLNGLEAPAQISKKKRLVRGGIGSKWSNGSCGEGSSHSLFGSWSCSMVEFSAASHSDAEACKIVVETAESKGEESVCETWGVETWSSTESTNQCPVDW